MSVTWSFGIDWSGDGDYSDTGEDVTARVLSSEGVSISYGRDQARALSPPRPGEARFVLNNRSKDYSPEYSSSPLAGSILPARPVRIQATLSAVTYTLYQGYLDGFDLQPDPDKRSVAVSCLDALARLKDATIYTDLYEGVRTGEAIGYVLDAVGWSASARDLDVGGTVIQHWWEEGTDAFTAIERLINSEGPGALVYVGADGSFVFRDRHHRLIRSASTTSQVTFRDTGAEPLFSPPLVYDHGWRDIVNSVTFSITEREPSGELSNVFDSSDTYSIADGETKLIRAATSDPFIGAVVPEQDTDYTLTSGTVTVTLSRTAGASAVIYVKATGGPAVVTGMRLRAYSLATARTVQVHAEESVSIGRYGRRSYGGDAPWAGQNDAAAIADILLAHYAERLPIVTLTMVNGNTTRQTQQLARDLSDRVTIVDAETGLNAGFHVEQISHQIGEAGLWQRTAFGLEKVPTQPTGVFILDTSVLGTGTLGGVGLDDPTTVFVLDTSLLDTGRLAY